MKKEKRIINEDIENWNKRKLLKNKKDKDIKRQKKGEENYK